MVVPIQFLSPAEVRVVLVFSKRVYQQVPCAKLFASGPADPLLNRYKFKCMICLVTVSMRSIDNYETKRRCQSPSHLRQNQFCGERYFLETLGGKYYRTLQGA